MGGGELEGGVTSGDDLVERDPAPDSPDWAAT